MKALVGSWDTRPHRVVAELTALRTRVAELQRELEVARAENAALRDELAERDAALDVVPEVVLSGR
jgi:predicted nuclease with TOPRIM domain